MKFSRARLFFAGVALIVALFYLQRVVAYSRSEFTHGVLVCSNEEALKYYEADMTLHYYIGTEEYTCAVSAPTEMAYKPLTVRYLPGSPGEGSVYTVLDFWFVSFLWMLFPLMVWTAFVFSFLSGDGDGIEFRLVRKKRNKAGE